MERHNLEVPRSHAGDAVARIVHDALGVPHTFAKGLIDAGCVRLNGRPVNDHGKRCSGGDVVEVSYDPSRKYYPLPQARPGRGFRVVHEDREIVVVDKEPGVLTSPAAGVLEDSLAERIAESLKLRGIKRPQLFVVHRLDRHTSGLLVFAKSPRALESMTAQFESREAGRTYAALVAGRLDRDAGTIQSWLVEDPKSLSVRTTHLRGAGKRAITHFERIEQFAEAALVRVHLETGRKHQIRIHFAEIGHPVLGDRRYGVGSPLIPRVALHAEQLTFRHPRTLEAVTFEAPIPEDLKLLIRRLRKSAEADEAGRPGSEGDTKSAERGRVAVFPQGLTLTGPIPQRKGWSKPPQTAAVGGANALSGSETGRPPRAEQAGPWPRFSGKDRVREGGERPRFNGPHEPGSRPQVEDRRRPEGGGAREHFDRRAESGSRPRFGEGDDARRRDADRKFTPRDGERKFTPRDESRKFTPRDQSGNSSRFDGRAREDRREEQESRGRSGAGSAPRRQDGGGGFDPKSERVNRLLRQRAIGAKPPLIAKPRPAPTGQESQDEPPARTAPAHEQRPQRERASFDRPTSRTSPTHEQRVRSDRASHGGPPSRTGPPDEQRAQRERASHDRPPSRTVPPDEQRVQRDRASHDRPSARAGSAHEQRPQRDRASHDRPSARTGSAHEQRPPRENSSHDRRRARPDSGEERRASGAAERRERYDRGAKERQGRPPQTAGAKHGRPDSHKGDPKSKGAAGHKDRKPWEFKQKGSTLRRAFRAKIAAAKAKAQGKARARRKPE